MHVFQLFSRPLAVIPAFPSSRRCTKPLGQRVLSMRWTPPVNSGLHLNGEHCSPDEHEAWMRRSSLSREWIDDWTGTQESLPAGERRAGEHASRRTSNYSTSNFRLKY